MGIKADLSDFVNQATRIQLATIAACFFLSGFAALLYQTVWLREFAIVFGTSELAVATVLAVYMGGLALGAAITEPFVDRITRPVLVYGLLEAGIAGAALCVPVALEWASALYANALGGQPVPPDARGLGQPLFYLLAGFVILSVPTGLMGATLPILMRSVVRTDSEIGPRAALLYGINTAGAVVGVATAGFWLLGSLGLRGTVWVGIAVNLLIFLIAASGTRFFQPAAPAPVERSGLSAPTFFRDGLRPLLERVPLQDQSPTGRSAWILPVMLLSGAATFFYEVLWTRLLSHVMGSSIYAFATMLAAFLTGIALGGGLASNLTRTREQAARNFVECQIAIAVISLGLFAFIDAFLPPTRGLAANVTLAASVLLPPAICIGVTFPLAVRVLTPAAQLVGKCTARVYAWNTTGAVIGAVIAGLLLIPALGFEGSIRIAVALNLVLALAVACLVSDREWFMKLGLLTGIAAIAIFVQLPRPDAVMRGMSQTRTSGQFETDLYFGVGRSSTVRLTEIPQGYSIMNNGLAEAQILPVGAPPLFVGWSWLTTLPVATRPDAESMLMVGLGGGVALEFLSPTLGEVHVVELEEEIVTANRLVSSLRRIDPLADARVSVVINDARNALRLTDRRYDIIVSQPSHPWTPGASHLYTTQFAELAKSRLSPGGVLLQWMHASFLDVELLRTLTATLGSVFQHVRLYCPDSTNLMFIASDDPLAAEESLPDLLTAPALREPLKAAGIVSVEDLLAGLLLDDQAADAFAAGAPISSDNRNLMATESRSLQDGMSLPELVQSLDSIDPLARREFWARLRAHGTPINPAYLATRLAAKHKTPSRLEGLAAAIGDASAARTIGSIHSLALGKVGVAVPQLREAVALDPGNLQARYLLIASRLNALLTGTASRQAQAEAAALTGVPAALLAALDHESRAEWENVAALDASLARSALTDIWFPRALKLRADWRLRLADQDRTAAAAEALSLIDNALPVRTYASAMAQRATAAAMAGNAPAALESSGRVTVEVLQSLQQAGAGGRPVAPRQREALAGHLHRVHQLLQDNPDWRQEARGPAIFEFVNAVAEELPDK